MKELEALPMTATLAQVCAALNWTEGKMRNRIQSRRGHPPFVKDGRKLEFNRDDVIAWYKSRKKVEAIDHKNPAPPRKRKTVVRGPWPVPPRKKPGSDTQP